MAHFGQSFTMESLPLDVLCYILRFEVAPWLVRLRSLSKTWRRAVDRVMGPTLPLALCMRRAMATETPVPPALAGPKRPVGCGVYLLSLGSQFVRLRCGTDGNAAEVLRDSNGFSCEGYGYALLRKEQEGGTCGTLLCFHGETMTETPVGREAYSEVQGLEWRCFGKTAPCGATSGSRMPLKSAKRAWIS